MKFVVSSTALLNVLQTSNKVVSNKNTLPILDNFLFELKDGVLKITASDLETTMIGTLKVDSMEQEGVIAAPVKLMIDSLKEFSEQPLTIEANESTWEIQISWKTGKLAIPGTSGLSYPTQPALDEETKQEISVDTNLLLTGINKTIFATADADTARNFSNNEGFANACSTTSNANALEDLSSFLAIFDNTNTDFECITRSECWNVFLDLSCSDF